MNETEEEKKKRVRRIIRKLRKTYPDVHCALDFQGPWQLLVATILSAQCTDKRVNMVTPALFKKFPDVESFARAPLQEIEACIRSTGFYRNKAKNIQGAARAIVEQHAGKVPATREALVKLPGVGRKTANVVLGNAFGVPAVAVDTHMIRLNNLLGFTTSRDPVKIEFELMPRVPPKAWTEYSHLIIYHGRNRCYARRPECDSCEIRRDCPFPTHADK